MKVDVRFADGSSLEWAHVVNLHFANGDSYGPVTNFGHDDANGRTLVVNINATIATAIDPE